jgi:tRNA 2-thiouridine synthesizing protein A
LSTSIDLITLREHIFALDVRGHVCPYPELLTLKAIQSLSTGDTLEVTIDNPPSVRDIPITLEKRGLDSPEIKRLDSNTWQIIIHV